MKKGFHNSHRRSFPEQELESAGCRDCSDTEKPIEVHHRAGRWLDGRRKNLVLLCHACHNRRHRRQKLSKRLTKWKAGFVEI
jgi:hypothetical protein